MSLINDALKEAGKAAPRNQPSAVSPLQPLPERPPSSSWLLPAMVVLLLLAVAGILLGWRVLQRPGKNGPPAVAAAAAVPPAAPPAPVPAAPVTVAAAPAPAVMAPAPVISKPAPAPRPVAPAPAKPPPPVVAAALPLLNPPNAPKLQGIDYSPAAPSAIVDGRTVYPGDVVREYRVQSISKTAVFLMGANRQAIQITMER